MQEFYNKYLTGKMLSAKAIEKREGDLIKCQFE